MTQNYYSITYARVLKNVLAVLPGTTNASEYVIYSAHWDHFGVGKPIAGDSIYNGAVDDGTGLAALLSIAQAFKNAPTKPARSIVFLAVTGEEQGLLGSTYYAQHSPFPLAKTVADLNMDMLWPYGPMKDLTVIGYGQSELEDYARAAAQEQDRYLLPDQTPETGMFYRSDHFSFAHVGCPRSTPAAASRAAPRAKPTSPKSARSTPPICITSPPTSSTSPGT